jgi:cardiolipin synthase A/B
MIAACRRGVDVNVVIDAYGAAVPGEQLKRLEEAGCGIGRFHPFRWYALQEASYRNHRKILVVDGRLAFTGGIGIADHWQGDAQDEDHWRDTQFRIEGAAVRYLEAAFYENLAESRDGDRVMPRLGPDDDGTAAPPPGHARSVVVASSPNGGAGGVKRLFLLSIAAARRSLDIQTPYFIMDDSTQWALEEARRRGVRIRLLVERDLTDAKPVKWASRADYEELLRDGVEIYEYQPTMMHAKATIIDNLWSIVGSANFDNRSLDMNEEMNIGIADATTARVLTRSFDDDLRVSRRLTFEGWRGRPVLQKVHERFWSAFDELF